MDPSAETDPSLRDPHRGGWVRRVDRRCVDCGLLPAAVPAAEIAQRLESTTGEWVQILTSNPAAGLRPAAEVWSPLEYGAHLRDVFGLTDARLALILVEEAPIFEDWEEDGESIAAAYAEQDPDQVAEELLRAAEQIISRIQALEPSQLERCGLRSDGTSFTVETFTRYLLHDVVHHLWDVTGQQDAAESLI